MARRSSYDEVKEFGGKRYTGMRVGRSHKWKYDAGEWKERKVTPDRWEFEYAVVKRRAGRAPEGSGAPVGTAHHWFIVADQTTTKLDANSYMTEMVGHKLKVAHRRADKTSWSASERAQHKQLVKLLRELADDLEARAVEEPVAAARSRARRPDGELVTKPAPASKRGTTHRASRATHRASRSSHAPRPRAHRRVSGSRAHARSTTAARTASRR